MHFRVDIEKRINGAAAVGAHRTSMLQDLDKGRPLELDALLTVVQELGRLVDVQTPTIDTVLALAQQMGRVAKVYPTFRNRPWRMAAVRSQSIDRGPAHSDIKGVKERPQSRPRTPMSKAAPPPKTEVITAALLVIGDEILSGRTKDKNIGYIAEYLTALGIDLKEVRIVADDEDAIVGAVNALRPRLQLCVHHRRHRPDP